MTTDTRHNGWANYPTWRVALELCADVTAHEITGSEEPSVDTLAAALKDYVEDLLSENCRSVLTLDYALAFLAPVNWHELAASLLED